MTYITIDTNTIQGKKFVELIETLPFAKVLKDPNEITNKAIEDAKNGKSIKHKSAKDLVTFLNK